MKSSSSHHRRPLAFLCSGPATGAPRSIGRRALCLVAAVPMVLLGTLLIPTPVPGIVLIGGGLAILSRESRAARRLIVALQWRLRQHRRQRAATAVP